MLHTRPDVSCYENRASQVFEIAFAKDKIKELNEEIKIINGSSSLRLSYPPLDKHTIHIRVYADASYTKNDNLSCQLGHLVLLHDEKNITHILDYSRKKSRRVVRAIMAGELCPFMNAFDAAYMIAKNIVTLLGFPINIFRADRF